jgi:hypothetical protein
MEAKHIPYSPCMHRYLLVCHGQKGPESLGGKGEDASFSFVFLLLGYWLLCSGFWVLNLGFWQDL